ncbi:hypothetical protein [Planctomicrobium sp. SH664]|uniref:hypothetical protein n=1 Tax=Planctomicrobium sp. SH664 TaxID=3448125 RepID=UPI003F5B4793
MIPLPVTLAVDIDGVIWVAAIFFMIVGWIRNLITGVKPPGGGPPRPRPANAEGNARRDLIQQEIDRFLKQGQRGGPTAQIPQPEERRAPSPVPQESHRSREEIWKEQTGKKQKQQRNKGANRQQPAAAKKAAPPRQPVVPAAAPVSKEKISAATTVLGESSEAAHRPTAFKATHETYRSPAAAMMSALRSRKGVRDAILIQEILSPPLSLRKKP